MEKHGLLAIVVSISVLLTGCPSPTQRVTRGDDDMSHGKYEQAVTEYEKALKKGDGIDANDVSQKLGQARAGLAGQARGVLVQAVAEANSGRYDEFLRDVEQADRLAAHTFDGPLKADVSRIETSRIASLARTARVYRAMCKEAGWSTFFHWLDNDGWTAFFSEWDTSNLGDKLVSASREVGDTDLSNKAADLSRAWDKYAASRQASRSYTAKKDDGWVGVLVDVGLSVNEGIKGAKFDARRKEFEGIMDRLFRTAPPLSVETPVASRPAAPVENRTAAKPVTAPANVAPASVAPVTPPSIAAPTLASPPAAPSAAPTAPQAPRGAPVDDDDMLRRAGS